MYQVKVGLFLKELRKEKGLTQEQLAEVLNVSGRTVSRWETGSNMPDLSVLVELSEFYHVDIKEIIDGERKSESMNDGKEETLLKVAEYAKEDKKKQTLKTKKIIGAVLISFGIFLIITALAVFPSDSSWGSIYSVIGAVILSIGIYQMMWSVKYKLVYCFSVFFVMVMLLMFVDYMAVKIGGDVPRFAYSKETSHDKIIYKAPFYTVTLYNYNTENQRIEIK